MAWIKVIDEEEAEGQLKKMYESLRDPRGHVDNILRIHSLNPRGLRAHLDIYKTTMHAPSEMTRAERETVAVVVSSINRCHY